MSCTNISHDIEDISCFDKPHIPYDDLKIDHPLTTLSRKIKCN